MPAHGWPRRRTGWNEPANKIFRYQGHESSRYLAGALLEYGFDIAYSYKPLHQQGLGHAFVNTLLYLDYDRKGFDYPVIPFSVNCYGSIFIRNRGGPNSDSRETAQLGIASSSWPHAFLTPKNWWLYPDVESDLARFEELKTGNYEAWRGISNAQIEDAGQQEMLNWMCLAGAMQELDRKPEIVEFLQTYVFNSSKCLAVIKP